MAAIGPPIFIVGCGHSGTTLLLAILSAHQDIYGVPYESALASRSPAMVNWFVRRFNRDAAAAGKRRWVEKTPSHVRSIDFLLHRFPTARVVVMVRDGRDVACSLRSRTGDLETGVQRWVADNRAADAFIADDRVHRLRYEDLVTEPEDTLRTVAEFLEVPFDAALLEHDKSSFRFYGRFEGAARAALRIDAQQAPPPTVRGSDHRLYRSWQARQPVYDGRNRWHAELDEADRRLVRRIAGGQLVAYGYAEDDDW